VTRSGLADAALVEVLSAHAAGSCGGWVISIPGAAHQVLSGRLVEHVAEALKGSGMPPSALTLEIT
jgi:hypothetical protein